MFVLFFTVCALLAVNETQADPSLHHLLDARFFYQDLRKTELTPNPGWIGEKNNREVYTYRLDASQSLGELQVKGTSRLQFDSAPSHKSGLFIDTLFGEYPLTNGTYVFVGRRHFVFGAAYGLKPADVFLDGLEQDQSLNEARRRIETKGLDAVGGEMSLSDRLTVLGFVAPEWDFLNKGKDLRAGLSATLLVPEKNLDLTGVLFEDKRPGGAFSMSQTMENAWVLYLDAALRQNRSRTLPQKTSVPGRFTLASQEDGDWYFAGTIGGGFTFATGVTLNLEYSRQGDGYNTSEWRGISQLIRENREEWENGPNPEEGRGGLMTLNKALRAQTLRQNYLFSRVFFPVFLDEGTSLEGVVLQCLDDASGIFSLRAETSSSRLTTLGLYASFPYGESESEFGLRSSKVSLGGYVTVNF